jgi:parallel beta-helix repeat protein
MEVSSMSFAHLPQRFNALAITATLLTALCFVVPLGTPSASAAPPLLQDAPRGGERQIASLAPTCSVSTNADSGAGSLRECLENATFGVTINFDTTVFPLGSPAEIHVTGSQLPDLDDGNVTIDASNAGVIVDGSALSGGEDGLKIASDGNRVKGLQIVGFPGNGISIAGADNAIGGSAPGERNIIKGNSSFAINIAGSEAKNNTVQNNWIGFGLDPVQQSFPADQAISPAFAIDHTLYVATLIRGVMKSTDGGATWAEVNNGLPEFRLMQIEIPPDATDAETVFVLAENGNLYRTDDGGDNWNLVSDKLSRIDRRNIALSADFSTSNTMYASAEGKAWGDMGDQPGVFVSTDGGVDWTWSSSGMVKTDVRQVFASPDARAADILFASTGAGIERSTNGGVSWNKVSFPEGDLRGLAISPDFYDDQTLFVTTGSPEVYRSTDGGVNWTPVSTTLGDTGFVAISPDYTTDGTGGPEGTVCHGGGWNMTIACSTDGGASWTSHDAGLPGTHAGQATKDIAFSPAYAVDDTLFVITIMGQSKSTDAAASFTLLRSLHDVGHVAGVVLSDGATDNTVGPDNVIANNNFGVGIWGMATANNVVQGNRIGTDPDGTASVPNGDHAVVIWGGHDNTIGGDDADDAAKRNVIVSTAWGNAVVLQNSDTAYNTVSGNYIGVDVTGANAFPGRDGVHVSQGAHHNTIGGDTEGLRNVISGHDTAVQLYGGGAEYNTVSGNFIGTNADGDAILGNRNWGVQIRDGASNNTIGGSTAGTGNVISGNGAGVELQGGGVEGNRVSGNIIGLDATGATRLGNDGGGVELSDGPQANVIGGTVAAERNIIAGNNKDGVQLRGQDTTGNVVSGNIIGSSAVGAAAIPNGGHGVALQDAGHNTIGGASTGERNLIVANRGAGVNIEGSNADANTVQGNWIGLGVNTVNQIFPSDQAISPAYATDCTQFVATQSAGVYKSTDCGRTWAASNGGLSDLRLMQVEIPPDAANAATVYALDENRHLYVSADTGATWGLLSSVLEGMDLRNLVLSANFTTDHTMYAAARDWAWDELGGQPGVFKSTDGGVTWVRLANNPSDPHVWKLVASTDPAAAGVLFALANSGIYRSDNGGGSWASITPPDGKWNDLGMSPNYHIDKTVAVTAYGGPGPGQVYFSTDGCGSWSGIDSDRGDPRFPTFSPNFATDHQFCHGGGWNDQAYCTTDGGHNWLVADTGLAGGLDSSRTAIAFAPAYATSKVIFMISTGGVARSDDRGVTWELLSGLRQPGNNTGVTIRGEATGTSILGNVISNNALGIGIEDPSSGANTLRGNRIGVNPDGTLPQANLDDGIRVTSADNVIEGNVVSGNLSDGIRLTNDQATRNTVAGNKIGTNAAGTAAIGNRGGGVSIQSGATYNVIGGDVDGERNVISGNGYGVGMWDGNTTHNTVSGNYIGTDILGMVSVGNGEGVSLHNGPGRNIIGGDTAGERNIISGNYGTGVNLRDGDTRNNTVIGNWIGVDATGAGALGNQGSGVEFSNGTQYNTIGDTTGGVNVISGNKLGIGVSNGAERNIVRNNLIGTDATGTTALGNEGGGVALWGGAHHNVIGGTAGEANTISGNGNYGVWLSDGGTDSNTISHNLIGLSTTGAAPLGNATGGVQIANGALGNTVGAGNTIVYNRGDGVQVQGGSTLGNTITENSIHDNDFAGILLRDGGNANLAAPRVTSHNLTTGTASGTACNDCAVEIFSTADEEGRIYEGTATADGSGVWSFAKGSPLAGPYVTATATDGDGNTSPFSPLFNLLVYGMGVSGTTQTLDNLGMAYDLVDGVGFATVDLNRYDVLFVGFTGNDPQPNDLLKPLYDRKADIDAFVRAGGGLVANSEGGAIQTTYDWQWVPVPVISQSRGGNWIEFPAPTHLLLQGLTQQNLSEWPLYHNTFSAWTWLGGEVLMKDPGSGDDVVLAGNLGSGRMVFSGADPDFHPSNWNQSTERMLYNELYWAAGMLQDTPPRIAWTNPGADGQTVPQALIRVSFDQMMDGGTVDAAAFQVSGSSSGVHTGAVTYLAVSAQAVFLPDDPFTLGERVTVTARGAMEDLTGNGLDGNRNGTSEGAPADDHTWSFEIRAGGTCWVSTTADTGAGSLRKCLEDAQPGYTIRFNATVFPPSSPATIALSDVNGQLPGLNRSYVTVDASDAGVILDGSAFSRDRGDQGINIYSDGNAVYGLQITGFPGDGIAVSGWRNIIGGSGAGQGNVIGSNGQNGIRLNGANAQGNTVSGNIIGSDATGYIAAPNRQNGITVENGAQDNLIGGPAAGDRNLIFSNDEDGVRIQGANGNKVQGNQIGLGLDKVEQAFSSDQAVSPGYAADHTLYVATRANGVYKSTDGGASWAGANTGLTELRLSQVEIPPDALNADTAYALSEGGTLFRTTDGGAHWTPVSTALSQIDRRNLVLSATFSGDHTMYAAAQNWASPEYDNQPGVFKSTDGGVTWAHADTGMLDNHVYKVIASPDPAAPGALFALTNGGIATTSNGGASWTPVATPGGGYLTDLATSPNYATDATLFVAEQGGAGRIHRSTNGGSTWASADTLRGDPRYLAVSPDFASDKMVCHGAGWNDFTYCSLDGGGTWGQFYTGLAGGVSEFATGLAFVPGFATNHTMFEISAGGMVKSTDSGEHWQVLSSLRQPGNRDGVMISNAATDNQVLDNVISNNIFGVSIQGTGTARNTVGGNIIGLDPTGASAQGNVEDGIQVSGDHNLIGGETGRNVISGNASDGVRVAGSSAGANVVAGNYIGTNAAGTAAVGNLGAGISIHSNAHNTVVGGVTATARNIISGNGYGVGIWDSETTSNTVIGNYIGLNAAGTAALGNQGDGVRLNGGTHHNVIGSAALSERNVISGNGSNGIGLWDNSTHHNTIGGNWIGTDAAGAIAIGNGGTGIHVNGPNNTTIRHNVIAASGGNGIDLCCTSETGYNSVYSNYVGTNAAGNAALGNSGDGINIDQSHDNGIGGDTSAERNVVSGNNGQGIAIRNGAYDNEVKGNYVGTNAAGDAALPNGGDGVHLRSNASDNTVGPHNLLAFNSGGGITMWDGGTLRNTVTENSIYGNDGQGIGLGGGANTELPAPVISEVTASSCRVTGTTCADCKVEVFSDAADEGRWYEGTVTANGVGEWTFSKGSACTGVTVRTTATDGAGNTSQFSAQPESPVVVMSVQTTDPKGVKLTWKQLEGGIDHFEVYRSTSPYFVPGTGAPLGNVGAPGPDKEAFYVDEHAFDSPPTNYYYIVLAVKGDGSKSPVMSRGGGFHFSLTPGS